MSATCTIDIKRVLQEKVNTFLKVCNAYARQAQSQAGKNAPWTDRTGDARKLLMGYTINPYDNGGEALGFGIMHRVEYGKWLEMANNGKYAILEPTVESLRESFLDKARETFGGGT
jgi:hypothetical protein